MLTLASIAFAPIETFTGKWTVAHTSARFMPYLIRDLHWLNVGCFIPLGEVERNDRGRKYKIKKAPFGGHTVFINSTEDDAPIEAVSIFKKRIPTASAGLVSVKDQLRIDSELRSLAIKVQCDPRYGLVETIRKGQRVEIVSGPFMGVKGIATEECKGQLHVQLTVEILGRAVALEVPIEQAHLID